MQLLTIRINNRINKILNFSNEKWSSNNTFIIRGNNNDEPRELFSIRQDAVLIDGREQHEVRVTRIHTEGNKVIVHLETAGRWERTDGFTFDRQRNEYVFKMKEPAEGNCVEVEFNLDGSDNHFSIFMYFAPTVYDAIVDFGSEASQACWYKNGHKKNVHITRGIHAMAKSQEKTDADTHDVAPKEKPQDKLKEEQEIIRGYVQFETDALYKSIYYMKKNLESTELKSWPDYTSDAIRFLVSNKEEVDKLHTEYFQLPNAKLSYFDITRYRNMSLQYKGHTIALWQLPGEGIIERILLNNIILQTLYDIQIDAEVGMNDAYVVLNVLMPNVYPIHVISEKLNQLAEDLNTLLKNDVYKDVLKKIKAVELRSVSESDASLLGYATSITNKKQRLPQGNYLIMDAGKGTLDFSLVEVDADDGYINKSKAGIIGAGNAITYGLIIGLVNDYLSEIKDDYLDNPEKQDDQIRQFIYDNILKENIDVAKLHKFNNIVEKYKKVYNELYETSADGNSTDNEAKPAVETVADGNSTDNEAKPTAEAIADVNSTDNEAKPTAETIADANSTDNEAKLTDETSANGNTAGTDENTNELGKFTQWIESLCASRQKLTEAGCKFVTIEIKNIAAEAIEKMSGIFNCIQNYKNAEDDDPAINFVVFTGRGFLMKEFQKVMLDYLKEAKIVKQDAYAIIPIPNRMKTGCLDINQKLIGGKYDASPSRQTIGILSNIDESMGEAQNNTESGHGKRKPNGKPDRPNALDLFDELDGYNTDGRFYRGSRIGDFEKDGIQIEGNLITGDSSLSIGGWLYDIHNDFQGHACKVFFDGIHYWITAEGVESQELGGETVLAIPDPPLCFESLFPNVTIKSKKSVIIPKERKQHIAFHRIFSVDEIVEVTAEQKKGLWKTFWGSIGAFFSFIGKKICAFFKMLFKRVDKSPK